MGPKKPVAYFTPKCTSNSKLNCKIKIFLACYQKSIQKFINLFEKRDQFLSIQPKLFYEKAFSFIPRKFYFGTPGFFLINFEVLRSLRRKTY